MHQNSSLPGNGHGYPPTQWTVVIEAASSSNPACAQGALDRLCAAYRQPIVNWFRRRDFYQDPEDLAQSFVAYMIEKGLLNKVTPRTGRFRAFLAGTMRNFLRDTWDKNNAEKRGRQVEKVPLDENDLDVRADAHGDSQFDVDFALDINRKVIGKLAPPVELEPYIFQKDVSEGWDEIAKRLGKASTAVRKEVSRLRRRHWEQFRDEVTEICTPMDRDEETRYLYELLFRNPPEE